MGKCRLSAPAGVSAGNRPLGADRGSTEGSENGVVEHAESFLTFKALLIALQCTYHCALAVNSPPNLSYMLHVTVDLQAICCTLDGG